MPSRCPGSAKTIAFPHRHTGRPRQWLTWGTCGTIVAPETPWRSDGPSSASVVAEARSSSPCNGSGTRATACAAGRRKPAGRSAIVTCWRSALTAGAVERLGPSRSALRDAEERLAAVIRRRTRQPRKLKQPSHTVLDTLAALVPRAPEAAPPPPTHHWWPSWWRAGRQRRGTATSWPSGIGSNSRLQMDSQRSRPSRPSSSTSLRRGRREASAARRCTSAPSTLCAS